MCRGPKEEAWQVSRNSWEASIARQGVKGNSSKRWGIKKVRGRRLRIKGLWDHPKSQPGTLPWILANTRLLGQRLKDFITSPKASSMSFMLICCTWPPPSSLGVMQSKQHRVGLHHSWRTQSLGNPQSFIVDCRQTWLTFDPDRVSITLASRETYPLPRWSLFSKAVLYLNIFEKKDSWNKGVWYLRATRSTEIWEIHGELSLNRGRPLEPCRPLWDLAFIVSDLEMEGFCWVLCNSPPHSSLIPLCAYNIRSTGTQKLKCTCVSLRSPEKKNQ